MLAAVIHNFHKYGAVDTTKKILFLGITPFFKGFYALIGQRYATVRPGIRMRAVWKDATFRSFYFPMQPPALQKLIEGQKEAFVFLDFGANQGLYSLMAAAHPLCIQVLAFEPIPETYRLLQDNIAINDQQDKIIAIAKAFSDRTGQAQMRANVCHSGWSTLEVDIENSYCETVELTCMAEIDPLIAEKGRIIAKIDVEGHEAVVLKELLKSQHISRFHKVFYELNEEWNDPEKLRGLLTKAGFKQFKQFGSGTCYDMLAQK